MKNNKNIPMVQTTNLQGQIESPHKNLLASFFLFSKNIINSDPIISGISFPIFLSFSELYENMKNDQKFRAQLSLFTMNKIRLINVVENSQVNDEFLFEDIYSINDESSSPLIIEVITISYLDLVNNKQIIDILNSDNAAEFNQHLFFFETCTWTSLTEMLANNYITLTVGSNTRRQFLSPIEYKFSLILMCLGFTLEYISKTFLNYEQYDKQQKKLLKTPNKKENKNYNINSTRLNNSILKNNSSLSKSGGKREFSTSIVLKNDQTLITNISENKKDIVKGERKREIKLDQETKKKNFLKL
jgi:hypothetical protein